MKGNVYKTTAQVTVFSTIEKALSFFYRIFLSRTIGAEGMGVYQICLSVFSLFLTACSSGVPITVSRLITKKNAEGDLKGKNCVVTAGVLSTFMFTVPIFLILFFGKNLFGFLFSDERCMTVFLRLLPGLVLTSVYAVMRGAFWGEKQFKPYSLIELAEDSVMVILGCILVSHAESAVDGAEKAAIAVLISYVFSFVVSIGWYLHKGGKFTNPKKELKPLLASSMPITAMRTSTSLLNSLVAVLLPVLLVNTYGYTSSEATSVYGVVMGMAIPILFIPSSLIGSIAVVVAPELSENFYKKQTEKLKSDVEKTVKAGIFIAVILIPFLFALGKDIGVFIYSNELSGEVIRNFSFMLLPMCVSMISTTVLNSMNCEIKTLVFFFIGAAAELICIFALTPFIGIWSYMIGTALDFTLTALLNVRLLKKKCEGIKLLPYTLKCSAASLACCLFGHLLRNLLWGLSPLPAILICGIAIALFGLILFYVLDIFSFKPLKKIIARN